jgi:hypothetical protein
LIDFARFTERKIKSTTCQIDLPNRRGTTVECRRGAFILAIWATQSSLVPDASAIVCPNINRTARVMDGRNNPRSTPTPPMSGLISPSCGHCCEVVLAVLAEVSTITTDKKRETTGKIRRLLTRTKSAGRCFLWNSRRRRCTEYRAMHAEYSARGTFEGAIVLWLRGVWNQAEI